MYMFILNGENEGERIELIPGNYIFGRSTKANVVLEKDKEFKKQFAKEPDYLAAHSYDAVNMLVWAIRRAGLNREKIRDVIKENSLPIGVGGAYNFGSFGENIREVSLGTVKNICLPQF